MKTINDDIGYIESRLLKKGIRLSSKGKNWCDNIEIWGVLLIFLVPYPLVGLVEGSKWFG